MAVGRREDGGEAASGGGRSLGLRGGILFALILAACSLDTGQVVEPRPQVGDPAELADSARAIWGEPPRTEGDARDAYRRMMAAVRASSPGDSARFERIVDGVRYALWLARALPETEAGAFADSALVLGNTAVEADSTRVEGYYYRAVAAGMVARSDPLKGRSAMERIREDARRAAELDPEFQGGGPHRVLGTLHLRAPGPPAGVGSLARALHHLERAYELEPGHPDNVLYLAEAYLEDGRPEKARRLLDEAEAILKEEAGEERTERTRRLRELRSRLGSRKVARRRPATLPSDEAARFPVLPPAPGTP